MTSNEQVTDQNLQTPLINGTTITVTKARLLSLAFAEACMRFREGHWREDVDDYRLFCEETMRNYDGKRDKGWEKRAQEKVDHMVIEFKHKQETLNRSIYSVIEQVNGRLSEENKKRFDDYVAGISILVEGFLSAKNTTELLTLVNLYNEGLLDSVFEKFKTTRNEINNQNSNVSTDDSSSNTMQEKGNNPDTGSGSSKEPDHDAGHEQIRELSNDSMQPGDGDEGGIDHLP